MNENKARITPYSIMYHFHDDEKDTNICYVRYFETESEMYHWAAKFYAFEDLDTTWKIDAMYNAGREFIYAGWQPGMLIEFRDKETNVTVYEAEFPQWDH